MIVHDTLVHSTALIDILQHLLGGGRHSRPWPWRGVAFLVLGEEFRKIFWVNVEGPLEAGAGLTA